MAWRGVIQMDLLPKRLQQSVGTLWVGPGAHIVHYPLRQGQLMNFVGVVERTDWVAESWSQQGTREELHNDFAKWHQHVHDLIDQIDTPFKWSLRGRQPLTQWSKGRITLLGDACHPTLPFLAQGAVMAIEDAYVLARALDKHADIWHALGSYDAARVERANRLVSKSTENGKRFHSEELLNPLTTQVYLDREWSHESVSQRYDWLYSYDVKGVSV
jgi:salicylate hydroxylase